MEVAVKRMFATISEQEFLSSDPIFRIIVHDNARKYSSFKPPQASHTFTMSWRSELVDPVVEINSSSIWIGVDQRIVCASPLGSILFSMGLDGVILEIKHFPQFTVALCDTHLIAINTDYTLRVLVHLKDLPDSLEMIKGELIIKYVSGEQEVISV
jgi:hypothetical protein